MNSTDIKSETPKSKEKASFSTSSALFGLVFGLGIAAAFWAGHEMRSSQTTQEAQALSATLPSATPIAVLPTKELLPDANNFIANIVASASPSVVNIDTSTSIAIRAMVPFHQYQVGEPFFNGGDLQGPPLQKYESHGAGSGLIIRSDGYILTNNHVIQQADDIKVTLSDGRVFKGKVVGKDKFTDVALVKIDAKGLKAAVIGNCKNLRPGDWAIAIGSPLGFSQSVTLGIISALGRSLGDVNAGVDLIQTDAAINPGNSGGPLLNIKGEVVGINQAIRKDGQNISFAIPIDVAKSVADQLMQTGSIAHAYLGISMIDMDEKIALALKLPADTKGVVVRGVQMNSPAQIAGLCPGDVIERINGKPVANSKDVQTAVRAHKPGEKLDMALLRQEEVVLIPVKIGDYEELKGQKEEEAQSSDRSQP